MGEPGSGLSRPVEPNDPIEWLLLNRFRFRPAFFPGFCRKENYDFKRYAESAKNTLLMVKHLNTVNIPHHQHPMI